MTNVVPFKKNVNKTRIKNSIFCHFEKIYRKYKYTEISICKKYKYTEIYICNYFQVIRISIYFWTINIINQVSCDVSCDMPIIRTFIHSLFIFYLFYVQIGNIWQLCKISSRKGYLPRKPNVTVGIMFDIKYSTALAASS